jgi:importin-9
MLGNQQHLFSNTPPTTMAKVNPETVLLALQACLDPGTQGAGSTVLSQAAASPDGAYPQSLLQLALAQPLPVPLRQLAAVTLKNFVSTHWSASHASIVSCDEDEDDEGGTKFIGPEPPVEVCAV